jgi:hypothetical protein
MKSYEITTRWNFKGRYEVGNFTRIKASGIRAAVGKALAQPRKGWREMPGRILNIKVLVIGGDGIDSGSENPVEG